MLVQTLFYFDLKKAFDSVSHPKLLTEQNAYSLSGLLLPWINAFLYGRSQSTIFNSCQSDLVPVISGVPQGSVLGPALFLLYINDVSIIFQNLSVTYKLYTDDITLYSCYTTNCRCAQNLSEAIEHLSGWSQTWQLHLAANKCFVFAVKTPKFILLAIRIRWLMVIYRMLT
jgi:ribonucleases P/MRP protein subunit RPP40